MRLSFTLSILTVQHSSNNLRYKIADQSWEFEKIHQLNYQTFVEEIPQHLPNAQKRLVDKFHTENTYIIALSGQHLVGMLAIRGRRPFSLDAKVIDLDQYIPANSTPTEFRLLAVSPEFRKTSVFFSLLVYGMKYCLSEGYDLVLISGTTRQLKLYNRLGFKAFGSLVGKASAQYQPMYLTLANHLQTLSHNHAIEKALSNTVESGLGGNFLPGPVCISSKVQAALAAPCISHRSTNCAALVEKIQNKLRQLTHARHAQIILGSGTLANEIVAAQLSLLKTSGVILSNGEFGMRLATHARRAQLQFKHLENA